MTDIIGAMRKEREYISFRMKDEEPYHLVDAVKEYGFESLHEYFDAKRDYEFSQIKFEVVETTPEMYIEQLFAIINKKKNALLLCDVNETCVAHGNECEFNTDYCTECGFNVYPLYSGAGAIVFTSGDLAVGISLPKDSEHGKEYLLKGISAIISKYTTKTVEISGNDILVGGYKISGSTKYEKNDMLMLIFNLTFSDKSELIGNICTKHSSKQPGYIDFMTREDFRREVEEWLRVQ
jgi:hypothetical protein